MGEKFKQKRWNLKDVLPAHSGPEFEAILSELEGDVSRFEPSRECLTPSIPKEKFSEIFGLSEQISSKLARLGPYGYLLFSEDTSSQDSRIFMNRMDELGTNTSNRLLFFPLWWKKLDDENTTRLLEGVGDCKYYLQSLKRYKPHALEEAVEQTINVKDNTGRGVLIQLYDQTTNNFEYRLRIGRKTIKDEKGRTKKFTQQEVINKWYNPDPEERKAGYKSLLRKYAQHSDLLGEIYRAVVRDWRNEHIKMRHYSSPISVRNLENDIPDEAVDKLLSVCRKNASLFQRFFEYKAKLCGMEKMSRYHIYAPTQKSDKRIEYPEGVELVLDTFYSFDEGFGKLARRPFEEDHVDSEIRKGKMGGGYCMSIIPEITPYVLINYVGKTNDVLTLGHEVGHAVHTMFASKHSVLNFHAPIPLCETASTFGEMLLFDRFMKQETDPLVRQDLLVSQLTDLYKAVMRQAYLVVFENKAHDVIENTTVNDLADIYLSTLKEQFGDAVTVPEEFKWEWTYIPHIYHSPFYCYGYSFGNLLTLSLYEKFRQEGESFKPKYFKILSYGGSENPEKILNEVGVDIRSEGFWQDGFNIIKGMVNDLEKI